MREGQRIGRINPDSSTNGGVPPHLHHEFHRYGWAQPGPDRFNPMTTVLRDEKWPGTSSPTVAPGGTIFGVDVSGHQDGMSLKRSADEGMKFAIILTTDGTYRDRCYRSHIEDAKASGLVTAAYHYLRNPAEGTTVRQQVDAALSVMGAQKRPVWIDVETSLDLHVNHIRECKRLFEAAGVRVIGAFSYVPYWEGMISPREPDSAEFGAFWVAAYGANRTGPPSTIYPGDSHAQWTCPLGNQKPILWQFGSKAQVAGFTVDINAFRGTTDQLRALFYGASTPKEKPMPNIGSRIKSLINPNVSFDQDTLLAVMDSTTWKNHVLLRKVCEESNLDPDQIIAEAIKADQNRK